MRSGFFAVVLMGCVAALSLPLFSSALGAKPPVCKSGAGRIGQWEYVVGPSYGEMSILLQMYRETQLNMRLEYLPDQKGYFSIRGKLKKDIVQAKLFINGKVSAVYNRKAGDKPGAVTWRGEAYNKIYKDLLAGQTGKMAIKLADGRTGEFDLAVQDYQKALHASVPHYKRIGGLFHAKKCRDPFDF